MMNSTYLNITKLFGMLLLAQFAMDVVAQSKSVQVSLDVEPNRCVALRRGSTCYQDVSISWQASVAENYCLYVNRNAAPLKCWSNSKAGSFEYELAAQARVIYSLKQQSSERELAIQNVDIAWVYKKSKRVQSTWRMF